MTVSKRTSLLRCYRNNLGSSNITYSRYVSCFAYSPSRFKPWINIFSPCLPRVIFVRDPRATIPLLFYIWDRVFIYSFWTGFTFDIWSFLIFNPLQMCEHSCYFQETIFVLSNPICLKIPLLLVINTTYSLHFFPNTLVLATTAHLNFL